MPAAPRMHEWPDPRRLHSCIRVAPFLDGRTTATDTQPPRQLQRPLQGGASHCLAKSPTRTFTTQTNPFCAALCAYIKLERLQCGTKFNHHAPKPKLYLAALHSAFEQRQTVQPFRFASLEAPA